MTMKTLEELQDSQKLVINIKYRYQSFVPIPVWKSKIFGSDMAITKAAQIK